MSIDDLGRQLKTIPDWRRGRTVQHPLWLMLLLCLLGVMSGYSSLRGLEDFMQRHQQAVAESRPATLMVLLRSWAISAFRKAGHSSIVRRNAATLDSIVTALPQIWRCAHSAVNHILIQQR